MTSLEAYDKAKQERAWAKGRMVFNLGLILLLVLLYAAVITFKGWHSSYLFGLAGFAMLGFIAYLKWREYRIWDEEIGKFEAAIFGGRLPFKEER
jgi:hypothetical protein